MLDLLWLYSLEPLHLICRMSCSNLTEARFLKLSVSETTWLTVAWAGGALFGFGIAAQRLNKGIDPSNLMNFGVLVGFVAFTCVIFASPILSVILFFAGYFFNRFRCWFIFQFSNAHRRHEFTIVR